ncbi:hypothetical protein LHV13_02205 [Ferrovum sp. PN-J185]|uniref:COG4705 family protein n=1 Tax=Ferrovum sp. PN-J185 TaxID=1356306 RepID=UPI0007979F33|nr:hypothetical protein [Ferrovum sp. PN-J185]KXW55176.1 hypothetical protein FV185_18730 [Ferrovum sp. PN-J185]MCC6067994.1 hypothetical protein [Ferrovum sp. PN-J185]MDE1892441.1 hypothetical protein [Betaproteobacteria bacterium]MDE2056798.1 hypothetical protein [Betaproteobacteria bacterium]
MLNNTNSLKAPEVTLLFWIIKVCITTLGETAGDTLSMSLGLGYLTSTIIFACLFLLLVNVQVMYKKFNSYLYWSVIIATTTVGTTLADFVDRALNIGYLGGTSIIATLLSLSLIIWYYKEKEISINIFHNQRSEWFYWITIVFSQTLGTALGDWSADTIGLGFSNGILLFGSLIIVLATLNNYSFLSKTVLFWGTFILTRPFGAVLGDYLDKPIISGGLSLDRMYLSSGLFIIVILLVYVSNLRKAH